MPEATLRPITDIDLATASANALPVATGPASVLWDGNFSWDPTSKLHTLNGQSAGTGGNRWQVQGSGTNLALIDTNGILVHSPPNNVNGVVNVKHTMSGRNAPVTFGWTSTINSDNTTYNDVFCWGHNMLGAGELLDATNPACRFAIEGNWLNAQNHLQFEMHRSIIFTDGTETRPVTSETTKDTRATILKLNASNLVYQNETYTNFIAQQTVDGSSNYQWTVYNGINSDGSLGFPFSFSSPALASTGDELIVGRNASNTIIKANGASCTFGFTVPGNSEWAFQTGALSGLTSANFYLTNGGGAQWECSKVSNRVSTGNNFVVGLLGVDRPGVFSIYGNGAGGKTELACLQMSASTGLVPFMTHRDNAGTILGQFRADASWQPPHVADTSATNDSVYYSTTASKLVYRDPAGVVNALY